MQNVCRPLYIYDDYLMESSTHNWEWVSFGYYDGIDVGENLFGDGQIVFSRLWDKYVEYKEDIPRSIAQRQIIWLMRTEHGRVCMSDEGFWEDASSYPFMIVSLVQVRHDDSYMDNWENRDKFEKHAQSRLNHGKLICYMTIDNSDMIIVQLTRSYEEATSFIKGLHTEASPIEEYIQWNLSYSYSIASVNRSCIDGTKDEICKNPDPALAGEMLEEAYIFLIERAKGGIRQIGEQVTEHLQKKCKLSGIDERVVLGCNDGLLIIRNIPWIYFLSLYSKVDGILNQSSKDTPKDLVGVTTIIAGANNYNGPASVVTQGKTKKKKQREDTIKPVDITLPYVSPERKAGIKRAMTLMMVALNKHDQNEYHDYLSYYTSNVIEAVLEMMNEVDSPTKARDYINSFYELTKRINILVQNTERSDRQFTQTPDFSIRLYDSPVKLNAFYSAFVQKMISFLGNMQDTEGADKHRYNFLLYPCLTDATHAYEPFRKISPRQRILLMEVPEHQLYSPQDLLFMLAHETGHFVGTGIRNREARYNVTIEIIADILGSYFREALVSFCNMKGIADEYYEEACSYDDIRKMLCFPKEILGSDESFKEYLRNMFSHGDSAYKGDYSGDRMDKTLNEICSRKWHTDIIEYILPNIYYDFLSVYRDKLWEKADYAIWSYGLRNGLDEAGKLRREFQDYMASKTDNLYKQNMLQLQIPSIQSIIDDIHYLCRESLSDLIAILTFHMSPEDYLNVLVKEANAQSNGQVATSFGTKNNISIRCAMVVYCMIYPFSKSELGYFWSLHDWNALAGDEDVNALKEQIYDVIINYIQKDSKGPDFESSYSMEWLISKKSLTEIIRYLLRCKRDYAYYCSRENSDMIQKELQEIYQIFSSGQTDVGKVISAIQKTIDNTPCENV